MRKKERILWDHQHSVEEWQDIVREDPLMSKDTTRGTERKKCSTLKRNEHTGNTGISYSATTPGLPTQVRKRGQRHWLGDNDWGLFNDGGRKRIGSRSPEHMEGSVHG